ncbi:hypothetical protein AMTRI_Chr08g205100 [Amborella trichopoda]
MSRLTTLSLFVKQTMETSRVDATTTNPLSTPCRNNANPGYNSSASTNPLVCPCKTNANSLYNSSATTNPRSTHSFVETNPSSSTNMNSDLIPSSKNGTTPSASTTSTSPSTVLTGIGFGCAHKNTGNFIEVTAGLGEGPSRYPSNLRLQVLVLPSAS